MRSLLACSALLLLPLSALAADAPNCKFTAARALKLDVAGAKTVVFEVNQHDLKVVASAGGGQLDGLLGLERLAEVLATALPDSLSDVLAGVLAGAVAAALTTPMDVIVTHVATTAHDGSGPPGRHPFQRGMDLIREQGSPTTALSDSCERTALIPL